MVRLDTYEPSAGSRQTTIGVATLTNSDSSNLLIWMLWSILAHLALIFLTWGTLFILQFFGFEIPLFNTLAVKPRDIEFVLVENPAAKPRDPNTKNRAERDSRSGGERVANKPIVEPQRAAGNPNPRQQPQPAARPTQQQAQPRQATQPRQQARPQQQAQPQRTPEKAVTKPTPPAPKRPTTTKVANARPSLPPSPTAPSIKLPAPPNPGAAQGPVARTSGSSSGSSSSGSSGSPGPSMISGAPSRSSSPQAGGGGGAGGSGSYNQGGSPGGGGGRPGVDAIAEPDFGPYIAELQRRIRRNWNPPAADRSKRVVAFFTIARDGRLLSVRLTQSSGTQVADDAALAAVRASAPFRTLPPNFRGDSIDVQFIFDYDVYSGGGAASRR